MTDRIPAIVTRAFCFHFSWKGKTGSQIQLQPLLVSDHPTSTTNLPKCQTFSKFNHYFWNLLYCYFTAQRSNEFSSKLRSQRISYSLINRTASKFYLLSYKSKLRNYSHCIFNWLVAKHAVIPSHSPVSARADSVSNSLRHFEFKFGLSAWSVVFSSCTPQRQSSFATHPPPLVEVDQAPTCSYPRCMPTASSVADSSHNLILCDEVMSMQ